MFRVRPSTRLASRRWRLTEEQRASWDDYGYLHLKGFFTAQKMAAARAHIDRLWRERADAAFVIDLYGSPNEEGLVANGRRVRFADVEDGMRTEVYKLNDVYLEEAWARDLALDKRLAEILRQLLNADPTVVNSLIFERGSTQRLHFDTYYMPGGSPGGMLATWIAFEDGHEDAGPLAYVPKSHLIPAWRNRDGLTTVRDPAEEAEASWYAEAAVRDRNLPQEELSAKAGDVFIWHEQLFHGGTQIKDASRTRKSLVTHYWRKAEMGAEHDVVQHRDWPGYYLRRNHPHVVAAAPPPGS